MNAASAMMVVIAQRTQLDMVSLECRSNSSKRTRPASRIVMVVDGTSETEINRLFVICLRSFCVASKFFGHLFSISTQLAEPPDLST